MPRDHFGSVAFGHDDRLDFQAECRLMVTADTDRRYGMIGLHDQTITPAGIIDVSRFLTVHEAGMLIDQLTAACEWAALQPSAETKA